MTTSNKLPSQKWGLKEDMEIYFFNERAFEIYNKINERRVEPIDFEGLCPNCKTNMSYKAHLRDGNLYQCYCRQCTENILCQ